MFWIGTGFVFGARIFGLLKRAEWAKIWFFCILFSRISGSADFEGCEFKIMGIKQTITAFKNPEKC